METLVHAIEQRLPAGSVVYNAAAHAVAREGNQWRVDAGGIITHGRAVLITAPAYVASSLLAPVDSRAAALCAEVPYVSTVSIALGWPGTAIRHRLAGSGFVVARRHNCLRITACTWVSSKWTGRAPAGFALLRAFIGGAHDSEAIELPDEELIAIASRDLSGVLGIITPPTLARVYRWRRAGAQHVVGQLARVREISGCLSRHAGLHVAGSGFGAVGIPDCIADGRAAAIAAAQSIET